MAKKRQQGSALRIPSLTLHKPTGQARVRLDGCDTYCGKWGTPEAEANYQRAIAEWLTKKAGQTAAAETPANQPISIAALIAKYLAFCATYYVKDDQPTDTLMNVRLSVAPLNELFGNTAVANFSPLKLQQVRDVMVASGKLCRKSINARIQVIVRMVKWGTAQELVPPGVLQGLQAVGGLKRGRSAAKDHPPVGPVPIETVEATIPHMPPHVREMVRLQLLSGCRPGEIVQLRPMDLDRSGDVWMFTPASHKTQHHGKQRRIYFGPQAQAILAPLLVDVADAEYVFSPRKSEEIRHAELRAKRKTPLWLSHIEAQKARASRQGKRKRRPETRYNVHSYRRAITRACEDAFEMPHHLRSNTVFLLLEDLEEPERSEVAERLRSEANAWRAANAWFPNQLRHSRATELRKEFGIDAASTILGHSGLQVTQVYAEKDDEKARQIMRDHG